MRNETNRLSKAQLEHLQGWIEQRLKDDKTPSQRALARASGVSQGLISKIVAGDATTLGTARQMAQTIKAPVSDLIGGSESAVGKYEGRDDMQTRGQALDVLSAVYDEEFLDEAQKFTPPPGSEVWTSERWVEHFVYLRNLWRSGKLKPKRVAPR